MEQNNINRKLIVINTVLLLLALGGIGGLLFEHNSSKSISQSQEFQLGLPSAQVVPLSSNSPDTLTFSSYYYALSASQRECVKNVFREERIAVLLKDSPVLSSILLNNEEKSQLQHCLSQL